MIFQLLDVELRCHETYLKGRKQTCQVNRDLSVRCKRSDTKSAAFVKRSDDSVLEFTKGVRWLEKK